MRCSRSQRALPALALLAAAAPALAQTPAQKIQLRPLRPLSTLTWHLLASDPPDDTLHPRLPDAKELSFAVDDETKRVWFKVTSYRPLPERFFGINVAIDDDGDAENGTTWWGTNKFKLDRLASAYLWRAEGFWQGVAGVADGENAARFLLSTLSRDVEVALDREENAILVGLPRAALGTANRLRVIATVGSMMANNDDIPNQGAVTVRLVP